jgi:ribonuclease HI
VPTLQSGGTACYAFIVKNGEINLEYGLDSTNNVDEYTGIIKALEWLLENNCENENIIIREDSLLVINQNLGIPKGC